MRIGRKPKLRTFRANATFDRIPPMDPRIPGGHLMGDVGGQPLNRSYFDHSTGSVLVVESGATYVWGWAIVEPTGSAQASAYLTDGESLIAPITLLANESTRDFLPQPARLISGSIGVSVIGTVLGVVYWT